MILSSKVRFFHLRYHYPTAEGEGGWEVDNRGGVTFGVRKTDTGLEFAVAYCCKKDNFYRKRGRLIVTNRFMSDDFYKLVCPLETEEDKEAAMKFILKKIHTNLVCVTGDVHADAFVW